MYLYLLYQKSQALLKNLVSARPAATGKAPNSRTERFTTL
jgi:hypothetical protein